MTFTITKITAEETSTQIWIRWWEEEGVAPVVCFLGFWNYKHTFGAFFRHPRLLAPTLDEK